MLQLIVYQEVHLAGIDGPPFPREVFAIRENQGVVLGTCGFGWRRGRSRRNAELDRLNLADIDRLRPIAALNVKLLGVAGLHRPGNLAAIVQGDDIGEEPAAHP
jgi:hypothetical protein